MNVSVVAGDPRDPEAAALLRQSHELMQSLFPPEDNYYLDIDALCVPEISFFIARYQGRILGTAALADKGTYGEVKSMFVSPDARGASLGTRLLARLETQARALGHTCIKLETGNGLDAAHRLYERHDFVLCGPFGDYAANQTSLFMEKSL